VKAPEFNYKNGMHYHVTPQVETPSLPHAERIKLGEAIQKKLLSV
jgi:hypothetical protein